MTTINQDYARQINEDLAEQGMNHILVVSTTKFSEGEMIYVNRVNDAGGIGETLKATYTPIHADMFIDGFIAGHKAGKDRGIRLMQI